MKELRYEYRRKLPHIYPIGAKFFITFCLKGSIHYEIAEKYKQEREQQIAMLQKLGKDSKEEIYKEHKRYFAKIDNYLDSSKENWILKQPEIAQIVANKMHQFDHNLYDLIAYCVMSNHVHLVFNTDLQLDNIADNELLTTKNYTQVEKIMQYIKGGSSYEINKLLGTQGTINWQAESYDHYVRNDKELQNIIDYTLQNPVKAGLVTNWQEWKFSYINENYL